MTEHHDIEEIRNLPSAELIELLPAVEPEKLAALRASEVADAKSRPEVIEAIDKAIAALPPVGEKTDTEKAVEAKQQTAAQKKAAQDADRAAADKAATSAREEAQRRADAGAAESADTAKAEATPAWQADNYDGPITIPQAEWRRANLKPARAVREK